jgi:hypothetical protein
MKESTKTAAFLGSAVAMLLAALLTNFTNRPQPVGDYETIGQPFYSSFEETNQAKSLVVTSIDPDTIKEQKFEIKQIDGLWQIPSHEGYPAEAAERLAKTSASLVGLTRDSLVGRRSSDHEKFGVVDPRNEDIVDIESVGQSITLKDANEDVLVDLIIGNQADGVPENSPAPVAESSSFYYVRRADETNVYRIPLDIELSTKFSDWIEPDLLQLQASDVVALNINNYQIEERTSGMFGQVKQLVKKQGDQISLARASSTEDWAVTGSEAQTEKVTQDAVAEIVSVLDDMAIVDVKKKPTLNGKILLDADLNYSLTPAQAELMSIRTQQDLDALSVDQQAEFQALQLGVMELQRDLESRGFSFGSTGQQLELVSAGGEMQAGTSDGLRYTLHIGKASSQTTGEIKVGGTQKDVADSGESKSDEVATDDSAIVGDANSSDNDIVSAETGVKPSNESESQSEQNDDSRYVLIRVAFDGSLLKSPGAKPTPPQPPIKPDGYTEAVTEADKSDDAQAESDTPDAGDSGDQEESTDDESAPKPADVQRSPAFVKYDEELAAYEDAQVDYEVALSQWETETDAFDRLAKEGQQKADILNGRFEKWYYIVSSDNLKTLQSGREDLIQPQIIAPDEDGTALQDRPDVSFPQIDTNSLSQSADSPAPTKVEKPPVTPPGSDETSQTDDTDVGADADKKRPVEPTGDTAEPTETTGQPKTESGTSPETTEPAPVDNLPDSSEPTTSGPGSETEPKTKPDTEAPPAEAGSVESESDS